jgi:hypothetical protein
MARCAEESVAAFDELSSLWLSVRPLLIIVVGLSLSAIAGCAGDGGASQDDDLIHVSCFQSPPSGRCGRPYAAYYYDYASSSCRPVVGGVCDSRWPFKSLSDCTSACGGRPR